MYPSMLPTVHPSIHHLHIYRYYIHHQSINNQSVVTFLVMRIKYYHVTQLSSDMFQQLGKIISAAEAYDFLFGAHDKKRNSTQSVYLPNFFLFIRRTLSSTSKHNRLFRETAFI